MIQQHVRCEALQQHRERAHTVEFALAASRPFLPVLPVHFPVKHGFRRYFGRVGGTTARRGSRSTGAVPVQLGKMVRPRCVPVA